MTKTGQKAPLLGGAAAPPVSALSEFVLARLREGLASGELAPGQSLPEPQLAEALGVSRGPIREALAQLEREGLVTLRRHRSAQVAVLSRQDVEEVYSLRQALERLAITRAAARGGGDQLDTMKAIVKRLGRLNSRSSPAEAAGLDLEFHDCIYAAAGHTRLERMWQELRPQVHRFLVTRNRITRDFSRIAVAEHTKLMEVIAAGDAAAAERAIEEHLYGAYERILADFGDEEVPDAG